MFWFCLYLKLYNISSFLHKFHLFLFGKTLIFVAHCGFNIVQANMVLWVLWFSPNAINYVNSLDNIGPQGCLCHVNIQRAANKNTVSLTPAWIKSSFNSAQLCPNYKMKLDIYDLNLDLVYSGFSAWIKSYLSCSSVSTGT